MENQLNTLITLYEEEKSRLLQLIEDCLKEEEYQVAYYNQRALYQLNGRLQTLHNIEDPYYDEKMGQKRLIASLEKRLVDTNSDAEKNYLIKKLQDYKEAVNKLNESTSEKAKTGNENILENSITDLLEKKIKSFRLILIKSDNLLLEFSHNKKVTKVVVPYVKALIDKQILNEQNMKKLINLGFESSGKQSKLVLELFRNKETIVKELKIILSKIVFEVFYFKQFQNESYIEIIH